jgi:hypothetical protein
VSNQIQTASVQQYKSNVQLLLQQRGSKLRKTVSQPDSNYVGKAAKAVEQIGSVQAVKRTTRHGDTPLIETPHDARWVFPTDYEWADLIDDQDKLRTLIDPESSYAKNGAYAMGRAIDDEILAAIFGIAKTGENGSINTSFPAAQQVPVNATGLTLEKLILGKEKLLAAEVDLENDTLWCIINADLHSDLLRITEVKSLDYNNRAVLVDGIVTRFLGINFVQCERILQNGTPDYRVPLYAKSGVHLGMWNDLTVRISERGDKSYSTQVYVKGTFGATRVEEKKVVELICD